MPALINRSDFKNVRELLTTDTPAPQGVNKREHQHQNVRETVIPKQFDRRLSTLLTMSFKDRIFVTAVLMVAWCDRVSACVSVYLRTQQCSRLSPPLPISLSSAPSTPRYVALAALIALLLFADTKWKQKSNVVKFLVIKYIVAANEFRFGN